MADMETTAPYRGRDLAGRERAIVALLELLPDFADPAFGQGTGDGDGGRTPRMPAPYRTPSVQELERLLGVMRAERPSQWWHVRERYLLCRKVRRRDVPRFKGQWRVRSNEAVVFPAGWDVSVLDEQSRRRSRPVTVAHAIVVVWDPAVRQEKVRRGVTWLAEHWGLDGEPSLPREVLAPLQRAA